MKDLKKKNHANWRGITFILVIKNNIYYSITTTLVATLPLRPSSSVYETF